MNLKLGIKVFQHQQVFCASPSLVFTKPCLHFWTVGFHQKFLNNRFCVCHQFPARILQGRLCFHCESKRTLIRCSMFLYCCKTFKMWYSIIFDHYVHHGKVLWGGSWVWCLLFRALIVLLWVIWIIQKSVECELCSALSSVTNLCSNIPSSHLGREPIQVGIPSNEWNFNWHFDHLIIFLNYCLNVSLPQIFFLLTD